MAESSLLTLDVSCVFMCKYCKTILAEGRSACACNEALDVIAFSSANKEVIVEETQRYDISPDLVGCVYHLLKCSACAANVGLYLTCAVAEVAHLRRLFCFYRKSVLCYSMKTKKLLEVNGFHFDLTHSVTRLRELQLELLDTNKRIRGLAEKAGIKLRSPDQD